MKENPLFGRKEVTFEIEENATPSRADVRREMAVILRTDLDRVWVRRMVTKAGTHSSVGVTHVYNEAADALKIEPEHIIKRNQPKKEAEESGEHEEPKGEKEEK